jgi:hypothetical protein
LSWVSALRSRVSFVKTVSQFFWKDEKLVEIERLLEIFVVDNSIHPAGQ